MKMNKTLSWSIGRAASWVLEKTWGSGNWFSTGSGIPSTYPMNWWQRDLPYDDAEFGKFGPVVTAINIISQDLAKVPIHHYRKLPDGRREQVFNKAPARIFRKPNHYQTRTDFILYLTASLLSDGNFYGYCARNERNEISSIYPLHPNSARPYITDEAEVVYQLGRSEWQDHILTSDMVGNFQWQPARNMCHVRLQTPRHPLMGETLLVAAVFPTLAGSQINRHNAAFFSNMSRPSGILRHPGQLKPEALERIKERWRQITTQGRIGEVPVLQENMDWKPLTMSAVDAELAKSYELSERQIFQLYRIPPYLYGQIDRLTGLSSESLVRFYIQSCLSFYVSHIETAFTRLFDLPPNEYIEFEIEHALLRSDLRERMEAYGKGLQNGVMSPNEARSKENLPPVEHGDEPRVQQQLVPLSYGVNLQPKSIEPVSSPAEENQEERILRVRELHRRLVA